MNLKKITQAFVDVRNQQLENKGSRFSEDIISYLPREQQIVRRYERNSTQKIEEMEGKSSIRRRTSGYIGMPTPHSSRPK